jgi:hypothetical protein
LRARRCPVRGSPNGHVSSPTSAKLDGASLCQASWSPVVWWRVASDRTREFVQVTGSGHCRYASYRSGVMGRHGRGRGASAEFITVDDRRDSHAACGSSAMTKLRPSRFEECCTHYHGLLDLPWAPRPATAMRCLTNSFRLRSMQIQESPPRWLPRQGLSLASAKLAVCCSAPTSSSRNPPPASSLRTPIVAVDGVRSPVRIGGPGESRRSCGACAWQRHRCRWPSSRAWWRRTCRASVTWTSPPACQTISVSS